jgi:hypothetical protein
MYRLVDVLPGLHAITIAKGIQGFSQPLDKMEADNNRTALWYVLFP